MLIFLTLAAGLAGTIVMTIGQYIEIAISKRAPSHTPAIAAAKVLRIDFENFSEKHKNWFSNFVHYTYGTVWAWPVPALMMFTELPTLMLTLVYFLIVWVQGFVVLKILGIAPWIWTWEKKWIFLEILFKGIYAVSVVLIFFFLLSLSTQSA